MTAINIRTLEGAVIQLEPGDVATLSASVCGTLLVSGEFSLARRSCPSGVTS